MNTDKVRELSDAEWQRLKELEDARRRGVPAWAQEAASEILAITLPPSMLGKFRSREERLTEYLAERFKPKRPDPQR